VRSIVQALPAQLPAAVIVAHHAGGHTILPELITLWTERRHCARFAEHGMRLERGTIYVCPGKRHVVVNPDATTSVVDRERVQFARPSIDWLFESVAASYADRSVAVVLSGASSDGARGARAIARANGAVIVQDPDESRFPSMPSAAITSCGDRAEIRGSASIAGAITHALAAGRMRAWLDPFAAA